MAEASWLRRLPIIGLSFFFLAAVATALAAFALHTTSKTTTWPQAEPPKLSLPQLKARIALLYVDHGDLGQADLPEAEKIPVVRAVLSPALLQGYDIIVVTNRAAEKLAKHPQLVIALLRSGAAILVQGPRPIATLFAAIKPGPETPLLLVPLDGDNRPGLPEPARAVAIKADVIYPDGKIAPSYTVYHNTTLAGALRQLLTTKPATAPKRGIAPTTILYDLDRRWYYIGEFSDTPYIDAKNPFTGENIILGYSNRRIVFYWTPDYNDHRVPANCLWRIILHDYECAKDECIPPSSRPQVASSTIPIYRPLLGWTSEPNMMSVNVDYYIDQEVTYLWPDMDMVGPASETVSISVSKNGGSGTYTLTIPDSIAVEVETKASNSSYFGRARISAAYWLWGFQTLLGSPARSGSLDTVAYVSAPCTAVDTRWPLAPPGLFVGIVYRDTVSALIVNPDADPAWGDIDASKETTYRFYVTAYDYAPTGLHNEVAEKQDPAGP